MTRDNPKAIDQHSFQQATLIAHILSTPHEHHPEPSSFASHSTLPDLRSAKPNQSSLHCVYDPYIPDEWHGGEEWETISRDIVDGIERRHCVQEAEVDEEMIERVEVREWTEGWQEREQCVVDVEESNM